MRKPTKLKTNLEGPKFSENVLIEIIVVELNLFQSVLIPEAI